MPKQDRVIVKVGGSLYGLPSLRSALLRFLASLATDQIAVFPGGGGLADAIRDLDKAQRLGEENSHWLAVRSLSVAAHFLVDLLSPRGIIVTSLPSLRSACKRGQIGIVDPLNFARSDARRADALPRNWQVTSDSLALRLAERWQASRLFLLKSATPGPDWIENDADEFVDRYFRILWRKSTRRPEIIALNFRGTAR